MSMSAPSGALQIFALKWCKPDNDDDDDDDDMVITLEVLGHGGQV